MATKRVLIVDDNADAAESMAMWIRQIGHEPVTAYDGATALLAGARLLPDLIFIDLIMPMLSGFELAQTIRQQPWGKKPLLVAITGWAHPDARSRSIKSGFDHYFIKPMALDLVTRLTMQQLDGAATSNKRDPGVAEPLLHLLLDDEPRLLEDH